MTLLVDLRELLAFDLGDRDGKLDRLAVAFVRLRCVGVRIGEQLAEVRLHREARGDRVQRSIGLDLGRVEVQLLPPDETRLAALLDDRLEEAAEDRQAVALPDPGQARVVRQLLVRSYPKYHRTLSRSAATRTSSRSERIPSKNITKRFDKSNGPGSRLW